MWVPAEWVSWPTSGKGRGTVPTPRTGCQHVCPERGSRIGRLTRRRQCANRFFACICVFLWLRFPSETFRSLTRYTATFTFATHAFQGAYQRSHLEVQHLSLACYYAITIVPSYHAGIQSSSTFNVEDDWIPVTPKRVKLCREINNNRILPYSS